MVENPGFNNNYMNLNNVLLYGECHASQEKRKKKLTPFFNLTFHNTDDVRSLNNCQFGDFVDRIYPIEFELKVLLHTLTYTSKLTVRAG
jgi:hypothetical protein